MKRFFLTFALAAGILGGCTENHDKNLQKLESFIQNDTSMTGNLRTICKEYPARLSGSRNNAEAQEFIYRELNDMGAETSLMEVEVPNWFGGESSVEVIFGKQRLNIPSVNLGLAEGTGGKVIQERVVEINTRKELGEKDVKGKIVFFNDPMKGHSDYGRAVWQRRDGIAEAAERGALGVVIRSVTQFMDSHPHTGSLIYSPNAPKISAVAISTIEAEKLSKIISENRSVKIALSSTAGTREGKAKGNNVIGEIKGSANPENIILVTGHLDSWHIAEGAHDDGSGVVIAMNVLRAFKEAGIQPYNTIRVMPYQDEEVGLQGIHTYSANKKESGEKHIFHLEFDLGVGAPKEISFYGDSASTARINNFLAQYPTGYKSAPILKHAGVTNHFSTTTQLGSMMGIFIADNDADYFLYHHASNDNFEVVDQQQLKECSAAVTKLIYLIDRLYK